MWRNVFFLVSVLGFCGCQLVAGLDKKELPPLDAVTDDDTDAADVDPDADEPDGPQPDTEDLDAADDAEAIHCEDNDDCDDGLPCTDDQCELTSNSCFHLLSIEGTLCRPSIGPCDAAETCDGSSADCPDDDYRVDGFMCTADPRSICLEGSCEESECGDGFVDTGGGESCEPPMVGDCLPNCRFECALADPECPDDYNPCNGEEFCDVGPGECSSRNPLDDGTECSDDPRLICMARSCQESVCGDGYLDELIDEECDDGNYDVGDGCETDCTFSCHEHSDCSDGLACTEDLCDLTETHACTYPLSPDSVVCRPVDGDCDMAEYCTGDDEDCPEDVFAPGTTECRPQASSCDVPEFCHGESTDCPEDLVAEPGAECDDGDPCTTDDQCNAEGECKGTGEGSGLLDVEALATGYSHTCAVLSTGALRCWGGNAGGQLGIGTIERSLLPVDVIGLSSGVTAVVAGTYYTCALLDTGGVKCWGTNTSGQLGDGTTVRRLTAVDVDGLTSGVAAIAGGSEHTCAALAAGGVKCWGRNNRGQLGDGTTEMRISPVDVTGLSSGAIGISAGWFHSCAVMGDGTMRCWGRNVDGQLGDGTMEERHTPVEVTGVTGSLVVASCGGYHTCAIHETGSLWCWGRNEQGQLGDGTNTRRILPTPVSGMGSDVTFVDSGQTFTCAVQAGGLKCWGGSGSGELGDGTLTARSTPTAVLGLEERAAAVSAGASHACGLLETGGVMCWGDNAEGKLGDGRSSVVSLPHEVEDLGGTALSIAAGVTHSCAPVDAGHIACWGNNTFGALGDGTFDMKTGPVQVVGLSGTVQALDGGSNFTCALVGAGNAQCWGANSYGQLGDGTRDDRATPAVVSGLVGSATDLTCGGSHACVLMETGGVKCWGEGSVGQLGNGSTDASTVAVDVTGLGSGGILVAGGLYHTCAAMAYGGVLCWGRNNYGQLGNGIMDDSLVPVDVSDISEVALSLTAGYEHTCVVLSTGAAKCWGLNVGGQLGNGSSIDSSVPVDVSGLSSGMALITAGGDHTCALEDDGTLRCWGANTMGQLGAGTPAGSTVPLTLSLPGVVEVVAAGSYHTCVLMGTGDTLCWGSDQKAQVTGIFSGIPHGVGCVEVD